MISLFFQCLRLSRDDFAAKVKSKELPYGQVPALRTADGKTLLAQSAAIMRMIGKMSETLYPKDIVEAAIIDSIIDSESDLFSGLSASKYSSRFGFGFLDEYPDLRKIARKDLNDTILPKHLANLERTISEDAGPWLAGRTVPSIADFVVAPRLKYLSSGAIDGISKDILNEFPKLKNLIESFHSIPEVEEYLSKSSQN